MTTRKKPTGAGTRRRRTSAARKKAPPASAPNLAEAAPAEPEALVEAPVDAPADAGPIAVPLSAPEPEFAARTPPAPPARPLPSVRRAIFFDVENTSRPEHVARVIDDLALDRGGRLTDLVAVGNWRVIGHETARLLARHGAHLVHSAPSVGVRDWSDLRIAVSAGMWLGGARPGDIMEVVSDDQAFDAVGDVAASLGVDFRRRSYRALAGIVSEEPVGTPVARGARPRRRRRGGRRNRESGVSPAPSPAANGAAPPEEPQTAPYDEVLAVVRDLVAAGPAGGGVSLDALSNALKARGFSRPAGSPRLITRLRRIKALEVSRSGMITLVDDEPVATSTPNGELEAVGDAPSGDAAEAAVASGDAPRRRRRRRGGRRRRGRGSAAPAAAS